MKKVSKLVDLTWNDPINIASVSINQEHTLYIDMNRVICAALRIRCPTSVGHFIGLSDISDH